MIELQDRYVKCIKSKKWRHSADCLVTSNVFVLSSEELNEISVEPAKKGKANHLTNWERQLKNQMDELWSKVQEYAEDNQEIPLCVFTLCSKNVITKMLVIMVTRCGDNHNLQPIQQEIILFQQMLLLQQW